MGIGPRSRARPLLLALSVALAAATAAPARSAGTEAAAEIPAARSQEEAVRLMERRLPGAGGRATLISPHDYLSALLLPLHRSGALKDAVAILPYDNALGDVHLEQIRTFLDQAGVSEGDRLSFRVDNGAIRGTIEGMAVALRTLPGMPKTGPPRLVVLDAAFPVALYRNDVKTPMVDTAWRIVLTLMDRGVAAKDVLVLDTVGRPDYPLEYGYLAALFREMLAAPEMFAESLPDKWRVLKAAERSYFFSQYGEATALLREHLAEAPGDASACYRIAAMALRDLDVDMALQWLNRAVDADVRFKRAYIEAAENLYRKDIPDGAERILLAALSKFPKDPAFATSLAAIYLSRGDALKRDGDEDGANEFFGMAAGVDGAEPEMRERARSLAGGATPGSGK